MATTHVIPTIEERTDDDLRAYLSACYYWILHYRDAMDAHAIAFDRFRDEAQFDRAERHCDLHKRAMEQVADWEKYAKKAELEQAKRARHWHINNDLAVGGGTEPPSEAEYIERFRAELQPMALRVPDQPVIPVDCVTDAIGAHEAGYEPTEQGRAVLAETARLEDAMRRA